MNFANQILLASSAIIGALLIVSLLKQEKSERVKLCLFWGMVIPIIFTTLYLAAGTVIKNQASVTGGPVHWHADFEIYNCGQALANRGQVQGQRTILAHAEEEIDLINPTGFSNRIGSSDFHEHGDNRIHIEGVVQKFEDVSLGKFFEIIGGKLSATLLRVPTEKGEVILQTGRLCPDGNPGTLQIFLYKTKAQTVIQEKLTDFSNYVISPYATVPPGDCLIIEFGPVREKTDKICDFYAISIKEGEVKL